MGSIWRGVRGNGEPGPLAEWPRAARAGRRVPDRSVDFTRRNREPSETGSPRRAWASVRAIERRGEFESQVLGEVADEIDLDLA